LVRTGRAAGLLLPACSTSVVETPTSSPGVNATKRLALAGGAIVFHKPFSGVHVANALAYGQSDETPPLHDAVGWRLAAALGEPWRDLVSPCVLREYAGAKALETAMKKEYLPPLTKR
jgi:hypothetical protein